MIGAGINDTHELQEELPFEIKTELDDDHFSTENSVPIRTDAQDKNQYFRYDEVQQSIADKKYDERIKDMENKMRENSEKIDRESSKLNANLKLLNDRYDKDFKDLKNILTELQNSDLKEKLQEMSKQLDEAVAAKKSRKTVST